MKIETFPLFKNQQKLVCLTAYDYTTAQIVDGEVDLVLVGDSLAMVVYGFQSTTEATLEMMIQHGQAVRRGLKKTLMVVDLPAGTYEKSPDYALENAQRVIKETNCDAVKIEGGVDMAPTIQYLTDHKIPVMAHIGLLPQRAKDGFKVVGKTPDQYDQTIQDALAVEQAGAFSVVIECVVEELARDITERLKIPTIGIGASPACDGQILVTHDLIGLYTDFQPRFVERFGYIADDIRSAIKSYATNVRNGIFPTENNTFNPKKVKAGSA